MKEEARIKTWFHPFKLLQNLWGAILNNEMTLKLGSGLILDNKPTALEEKNQIISLDSHLNTFRFWDSHLNTFRFWYLFLKCFKICILLF